MRRIYLGVVCAAKITAVKWPDQKTGERQTVRYVDVIQLRIRSLRDYTKLGCSRRLFVWAVRI